MPSDTALSHKYSIYAFKELVDSLEMIQKRFCKDIETPEPILQLETPETPGPEKVKMLLTHGP